MLFKVGVVHDLFKNKNKESFPLNNQLTKAQSVEDQLIKNIRLVTNDPKLMELLTKRKPRKSNKPATNLWKIKLEGVYYSHGNRQEAFREVDTGDAVSIKFDFYNQYDQNALGAYTKTNKLLGYIPKNNKRLIGFIRNQGNKTAIIIEKESGKTQWDKKITIEISMT